MVKVPEMWLKKLKSIIKYRRNNKNYSRYMTKSIILTFTNKNIRKYPCVVHDTEQGQCSSKTY